MALAKITCGSCGGGVRLADTTCPHCGAPVEFEQQAASRSAGRSGAGRARPVRRPAAWAIAVGVGAAALGILFVVLEANREHAPVQQSPPPGTAASQLQELRKEISRLEEQAAVRKDDMGVLLALANRLHDLGMSDPSVLSRAIDAYTRYLAQRPDDPNARVDMGICYFELGRTDSVHGAHYVTTAVQEMKAVAQADPRHQPAAFNLGVVHLYMGAAEESSAWFRKAVAIAPDTPLGKRAQSLLEQHTFPAQGTP